MKRSFVLSGPAQRDVNELLDHVSETSGLRRAQHVHEELHAAFQSIANMPGLGHFRDDLTSGPVRFDTVWAYHIIYKPESSPVMIARVLHAARDVRRELEEDAEYLGRGNATIYRHDPSAVGGPDGNRPGRERFCPTSQ